MWQCAGTEMCAGRADTEGSGEDARAETEGSGDDARVESRGVEVHAPGATPTAGLAGRWGSGRAPAAAGAVRSGRPGPDRHTVGRDVRRGHAGTPRGRPVGCRCWIGSRAAGWRPTVDAPGPRPAGRPSRPESTGRPTGRPAPGTGTRPPTGCRCRPGWSGRAARRRGSRGEARRLLTATSSASSPQSGPSRSGPRWPTRVASWSVRTTSSMPRRTPWAVHSVVASTARTAWPAGRASRVRTIRHDPSIRRWEWIVQPDARRCSRCLPRLTTSVVITPRKSRVDNSGQRRSDTVSGDPANAWLRRCAVRQTVSPSGISGAASARAG